MTKLALFVVLAVSGCASIRNATNNNVGKPSPAPTAAQQEESRRRTAALLGVLGAAVQASNARDERTLAEPPPAPVARPRPLKLDCEENGPGRARCVER